MTNAAFRVYPSKQYSYIGYDRNTPLFADIIEFDRSNEYDIIHFAFKAFSDKYMRFFFNMLFQFVPDTCYLTPCLFRSTDNGNSWHEIAGTDFGASSYPGANSSQGLIVTRSIFMNAGDMVRAHPCIAVNGTLCNSIGGLGIATCNYFEGEEI